MNKFLLIVFILPILFSCKEDNPSVYFGYEYFGLKKGSFVEYDVQYIFHDENIEPFHDTTNYRIKTIVGEEIIDNSGRTVNKFHRQLYNTELNQWEDLDLYTAVIDKGRGEIVEENQRKIKLTFAINKNKEWDANAFNTADVLECTYDGVHKPKQINGILLDSTVTVEQEDFLSLIDYQRKYEVYGNHVGLMEVYYKDLKINNFDTLDISKGEERYFKITNYGVQ